MYALRGSLQRWKVCINCWGVIVSHVVLRQIQQWYWPGRERNLEYQKAPSEDCEGMSRIGPFVVTQMQRRFVARGVGLEWIRTCKGRSRRTGPWRTAASVLVGRRGSCGAFEDVQIWIRARALCMMDIMKRFMWLFTKRCYIWLWNWLMRT